MPANTSPIFTLTPNIGRARLTSAVLTSDGTGATTVFTAGTNGSRLDRITVRNSQATAATSSAMTIRIYISDNAGANYRLYAEQTLATATRSTTAIGATTTFNFLGGLIIPSGTLVGVSQSVYAGVADQNDVIAEGGDY